MTAVTPSLTDPPGAPPATAQERPAPPVVGVEIEAGVIEDARARQRRHRRAGAALLLAAVLLGALITGMAGGGGGGSGGRPGGGPSGSSPGAGPALAGASPSFPGAPATQRGADGVASDVCPPAPPNRYLPARSGCVTVRRADVNGDGRADLIIVYSRLSPHRLFWPSGTPPSFRGDLRAEAAFLRVVLADGSTVTTRIMGGGRAAAVAAVARVNGTAGVEVFLEVNRTSSGATAVAYGFHGGRLVPAGVYLGYDGDSGVQAGFNCLAGRPPRLIQRVFAFVGPNENTRSWRESEVVYAWHGPRLVRLSRHTMRRLVALKPSQARIGTGCLRGVS